MPRFLWVILFAGACIGAPARLWAQAVTVRVEVTTVSAGQSATLLVGAPSGASLTITTTGPAPVAPVQAIGTGAEQRLSVGPFIQPGDYEITVVGGGRQARASMRVSFPPSDGSAASAGNAGHACRQAGDALIESLNGARQGLSNIPGREPTIEETKQAMDGLQRQLDEIRGRADETATTLDRYGELLNQEPNASRAVKDEFTRLQNEISQALNEQARQVIEFGRDASKPAEDPCEAAMAVATALHGSSSVLDAMQNVGPDFGRRQQVTPGGDGAEWARSRVTGGQPLRGEGTAGSSAAAWREIKNKIDGLVSSGAASSYSEAQKMIDRATGPSGLGGYSGRQCQKFTGDWSGTTSVEALDKGHAFYGLMNDWTAHVELAAARTSSTPTAEAPIRGTLVGRASNFKVINLLRTLYAGRPAKSIEYLTTDPTPAQQASATFVASIEGFIRGTQMTLKIRPGGIDYSGRVTGKLAAIVIPMASPVPLVQTFDVVFQGGNWQVTRAIGPSGTTERALTITVGGGKRMVQTEYPRLLSSAGAHGQFTIKIRLCSGCD